MLSITTYSSSNLLNPIHSPWKTSDSHKTFLLQRTSDICRATTWWRLPETFCWTLCRWWDWLLMRRNPATSIPLRHLLAHRSEDRLQRECWGWRMVTSKARKWRKLFLGLLKLFVRSLLSWLPLVCALPCRQVAWNKKSNYNIVVQEQWICVIFVISGQIFSELMQLHPVQSWEMKKIK